MKLNEVKRFNRSENKTMFLWELFCCFDPPSIDSNPISVHQCDGFISFHERNHHFEMVRFTVCVISCKSSVNIQISLISVSSADLQRLTFNSAHAPDMTGPLGLSHMKPLAVSYAGVLQCPGKKKVWPWSKPLNQEFKNPQLVKTYTLLEGSLSPAALNLNIPYFKVTSGL